MFHHELTLGIKMDADATANLYNQYLSKLAITVAVIGF